MVWHALKKGVFTQLAWISRGIHGMARRYDMCRAGWSLKEGRLTASRELYVWGVKRNTHLLIVMDLGDPKGWEPLEKSTGIEWGSGTRGPRARQLRNIKPPHEGGRLSNWYWRCGSSTKMRAISPSHIVTILFWRCLYTHDRKRKDKSRPWFSKGMMWDGFAKHESTHRSCWQHQK